MNTFLTLDLNNKVPPAGREKMYAELAKLGWKKLSPVTTLWQKTWQDGHAVGAYEQAAFKDAATAARAAQVLEYDARVITSVNESKAVKVAPPMAVRPAVSAFAALRRPGGTAASGAISPVTAALLNPYLAEARRRSLAQRFGK